MVRRGAVVTFVASLLFRAWLFFSGCVSNEMTTGDSFEYKLLAESLLKFHVFGWDGVPKMNRTPGYPAFLAVVFELFGSSQAAVVSSQIVVDAVTAVLVVDLARRWRLGRAGCAASALAAISCVFTAVLSFQEMTETVYTLGVVLAVWLLPDGGVRSLSRRRNLVRVFASGLVVGGTALVRPVEALTLAAFAVVVAILALRRLGGGVFTLRFVRGLLVFGLGGAFALGPWMVRNRVVFAFEFEKAQHENVTLMGYTTDVPVFRHWYSREFTLFRRSYEEPMVMENPYEAPVVARYVYAGEKEDVSAAFEQLTIEIHASTTEPIRPETLAMFERIGRKRYLAAPRLHLTAPLSRAAKLWIAPRASLLAVNQHGGRVPLRVSIGLTLYDLAYVGPGFLGLALTRRRASLVAAGILATVIAHTALYALWHSAPHSRYAVPLFPFLCLGLGCLVDLARRRLNGRRSAT